MEYLCSMNLLQVDRVWSTVWSFWKNNRLDNHKWHHRKVNVLKSSTMTSLHSLAETALTEPVALFQFLADVWSGFNLLVNNPKASATYKGVMKSSFGVVLPRCLRLVASAISSFSSRATDEVLWSKVSSSGMPLKSMLSGSNFGGWGTLNSWRGPLLIGCLWLSTSWRTTFLLFTAAEPESWAIQK